MFRENVAGHRENVAGVLPKIESPTGRGARFSHFSLGFSVHC